MYTCILFNCIYDISSLVIYVHTYICIADTFAQFFPNENRNTSKSRAPLEIKL